MLRKAPPFFEDFQEKKRYALYWISQLKPLANVSYDEVEKARNDIYAILVGTENMITEKFILDSPVVYDSHVTEITKTSVKLNYGILCKLPIENSVLEIYNDKEMNHLLKSYTIPNNFGYHD